MRFTTSRIKILAGDVLDNLNYQFMRQLKQEGPLTLKELFIDGTKIEANTNHYTFVWRGSINYHLADLFDTIDSLYRKYNTLLQEKGDFAPQNRKTKEKTSISYRSPFAEKQGKLRNMLVLA